MCRDKLAATGRTRPRHSGCGLRADATAKPRPPNGTRPDRNRCGWPADTTSKPAPTGRNKPSETGVVSGGANRRPPDEDRPRQTGVARDEANPRPPDEDRPRQTGVARDEANPRPPDEPARMKTDVAWRPKAVQLAVGHLTVAEGRSSPSSRYEAILAGLHLLTYCRAHGNETQGYRRRRERPRQAQDTTVLVFRGCPGTRPRGSWRRSRTSGRTTTASSTGRVACSVSNCPTGCPRGNATSNGPAGNGYSNGSPTASPTGSSSGTPTDCSANPATWNGSLTWVTKDSWSHPRTAPATWLTRTTGSSCGSKWRTPRVPRMTRPGGSSDGFKHCVRTARSPAEHGGSGFPDWCRCPRNRLRSWPTRARNAPSCPTNR